MSALPRNVSESLRLLGGSALLILAALLLYHRLWVAPALRVGIIDLSEIYRTQEAAFTRQVSAARSNNERDAALAQVNRFAQRLTRALDELPRECNCLVLIKGAATAPPGRLRDLTADLQRKVAQP